MLLALLLPLIGLIAGVVYVAKGDERRQVGLVTIALSCVALLGWAVILTGPSSGAGYAY